MIRILLLALLLALPLTAATAGEHPLPDEVQGELERLPDALGRVSFLQNRLREQGPDPALLLRLGNEFFDQGQYQDAISAYEGALALDEEFLGARVNLGSVYDELGQLREAANAYKLALQLDPEDEKTLCNLGGVFFKQRQYERAMNSFQQALLHNPQSQLAHYNLAILFADSGIYEEAANEWAAAVAIDPESDLGRRSAGNIQIIRDLQEQEAMAGKQSGMKVDSHGPGDGHGH